MIHGRPRILVRGSVGADKRPWFTGLSRLRMILNMSERPLTLVLHLKAKYFHAIRAGVKTQEFRRYSDYWRKRIAARAPFDIVELRMGYPKKYDKERILQRAWRGYEVITMTYPEFGPDPVEVFAIDLTGLRLE